MATNAQRRRGRKALAKLITRIQHPRRQVVQYVDKAGNIINRQTRRHGERVTKPSLAQALADERLRVAREEGSL